MEEFHSFYEYYEHLCNLLKGEDWASAEKVAPLISVRHPHADYEFLQVRFIALTFLNIDSIAGGKAGDGVPR